MEKTDYGIFHDFLYFFKWRLPLLSPKKLKTIPVWILALFGTCWRQCCCCCCDPIVLCGTLSDLIKVNAKL